MKCLTESAEGDRTNLLTKLTFIRILNYMRNIYCNLIHTSLNNNYLISVFLSLIQQIVLFIRIFHVNIIL